MAPPGLDVLWSAYGHGSAMLFGSAPEAHIDLLPGGALTLSGEPFIEINWGVIEGRIPGDPGGATRGGPVGDRGGEPQDGSGGLTEDPAAVLRRFVAAIRSGAVDAYLMAGSAAAAELDPLASGLGLVTGPGSPLMLRRRTSERVFVVQQETVTVERVADDWGLRDVASVLEKAFEAPPGVIQRAFPPAMLDVPGLDVFVLRLAGEAASAVVTTRVGNLAGIWAMGTVPALRLRHLGRRLLEAVIDFHTESPHPADWFFLTSSNLGRPLYDALGFTVVDETLFIDVPATGASSG